MAELGYKNIPPGRLQTSHAAIQFCAKGICQLRSVESLFPDTNEDVATLDISEQELIGRLCIGNLLYAQGLELIFKLVFLAEEFSDSEYRQHELVGRFDKLLEVTQLRDNIEKYIPSIHSDKILVAKKVVLDSEKSFMPSRYFGLRTEQYYSVTSLDAAGLLLALVFTYQGLNQVEAVKIIGIDIKLENGEPANYLPARVSMKEFKSNGNA